MGTRGRYNCWSGSPWRFTVTKSDKTRHRPAMVIRGSPWGAMAHGCRPVVPQTRMGLVCRPVLGSAKRALVWKIAPSLGSVKEVGRQFVPSKTLRRRYEDLVGGPAEDGAARSVVSATEAGALFSARARRHCENNSGLCGCRDLGGEDGCVREQKAERRHRPTSMLFTLTLE